MDGELARVEMIDLAELAVEAVAEAAKRVSEIGTNEDITFEQEAENEFSSGASGLESPAHLSSFQVAGGDEDGEQARACATIAVTWDRADHMYYPGPLSRSNTLKANVLAFLREKLAEIQDRLPIDWESAGLLITYLELMVKNNGVVQPSDLVNLLLEGHESRTGDLRTRANNFPGGSSLLGVPAMRNVAYRDSLTSLPPSEPPSGRQSPLGSYSQARANSMQRLQGTKAASEVGGVMSTDALLKRASAAMGTMTSSTHRQSEVDDRVVDRFRELLTHGMAMEALEHACRTQLWGHAFVLAERIGPAIFKKVMDKFLLRAIPSNDPILTYYQISAGEMPQAVTEAAYGRGADIGEWRPHLAMILAAESTQPELVQAALERLGDSLFSRRLVYAAHLCYLLIGPLYDQVKVGRGQPLYRLPSKIWLLGVPRTFTSESGLTDVPISDTQSPLTATSESVQLTEIYEYTMKLANRNYRLPQLLPFKLIYATRLIDAGLLNKANRYLNAIASELTSEAEALESEVPPVLYSLTENCLRLAEPLQSHPDLDGFDLTTGGTPAPAVQMMNRLRPLDHSAVNDTIPGWIDRLRSLYDQLNKKLGRPTYGTFEFSSTRNQTPNVPVVKSEAPHPSPFHQHQHSHSTHSEPVNPEIPGCHQPTSNSVRPDTSTSGRPASAYLVHGQAQNYPQPDLESTCYQQSQGSLQPGSNTYSVDPSLCQSGYSSKTLSEITDSMKSIRMSSAPNQEFHPKTDDHPETQTVPNLRVAQPHCQPSNPHFVPDGVDLSNLCAPSQSRPNSVSQLDNLPHSSSQPIMGHSQLVPQSNIKQPNLLGVAPPVSNSTQAPSAQSSHTNTFFNPSLNFPPPSDASAPTTPKVFDYFAGMHYQSVEKSENRSRTASGGSQGSSPGSHLPSSPTAFHTQGSKSRNSSGAIQNRRNSGYYDRQPLTNSQQVQNPIHLGRSNDLQHAAIKEEPRGDDAETKHGDITADSLQSQSKDGWFSGLFGKLKRNGSKNIHLPDDSKPSIIWDKQMQQWIDVTNPEVSNPTPLPPPQMSPPNMLSNPIPSNQAYSIQPQLNSNLGRTTNRSRYVNVLANQTSGSASSKTDVPLHPPLPPVCSPYSEGHQTSLPLSGSNDGHQNEGGNTGLLMYN